eukprot:358210-Chlamydomonas_euryale.AAC.2
MGPGREKKGGGQAVGRQRPQGRRRNESVRGVQLRGTACHLPRCASNGAMRQHLTLQLLSSVMSLLSPLLPLLLSQQLSHEAAPHPAVVVVSNVVVVAVAAAAAVVVDVIVMHCHSVRGAHTYLRALLPGVVAFAPCEAPCPMSACMGRLAMSCKL